jgi:hypothetical protein
MGICLFFLVFCGDVVSQEFEYVHGAWLYLCHVFGKYPLQNASDMFEEFIKKSAQFFNTK